MEKEKWFVIDRAKTQSGLRAHRSRVFSLVPAPQFHLCHVHLIMTSQNVSERSMIAYGVDANSALRIGWVLLTKIHQDTRDNMRNLLLRTTPQEILLDDPNRTLSDILTEPPQSTIYEINHCSLREKSTEFGSPSMHE